MAKNGIEEILEKYRIKNYNKEKITEEHGKITYYSKEKHIREIDLLHQKIFKSTNKNDTNQPINQKTNQPINQKTNQPTFGKLQRTNEHANANKKYINENKNGCFRGLYKS